MQRNKAPHFLFLMAMAGLTFAISSDDAVGREVFIDFDHFPGPDGVLGTMDDIPIQAKPAFHDGSNELTSEFSSVGIQFVPTPPLEERNEVLLDISFAGTVNSSPNLLSTHRDIYPGGPIEAVFTVEVYELSMAVGLVDIYYGGFNRLEVFDSSGFLLGSVSGLDQVVTVSTEKPIASFRVIGFGVQSGASNGQASIDDIRFVVVPAPMASSLALAALICATSRRSRS